MLTCIKKTLLITTLLLTGAVQSYAAEDIAAITAKVDAIRSDPERLQSALQQGKDISSFCEICHGSDGNAEREGMASLAAQNPAYFAYQLNKFANRERQGFTGVMSSIARSLTEEERMSLALHYSTTELKALPYDETMAQAGKTIFQTTCQLCHGEDGLAKNGYVRIAGQKQDYVIDTLKMFRDQEGGKYRERESIEMAGFVKEMTDEQFEQLAHYITSLANGTGEPGN